MAMAWGTGRATSPVLRDVQRLRRRVRRDQRATSVPLLVFGLLTLGSTVVTQPTPAPGLTPATIYWLLAIPLGFSLVALIHHRRRKILGVGTPTRAWAMAALVLGALLLTLPGLVLFRLSFPVVGIGIVAMGMYQRNAPMAVAGGVFGIVGALETFYVLSNGVADLAGALDRPATSWLVQQRDVVAVAALGAATTTIGLVARWREVRT